MSTHTLDVLPDWPLGTVAVLSVGGDPDGPHAIPISTARRAGDRRLVLGLGSRRETLDRLRRDPACALTVVAAGVAFTAIGSAVVVADPVVGAVGLVAVAVDVRRIQDHLAPTYAIEGGVRWRWTDADAEAADSANRVALARLADEG